MRFVLISPEPTERSYLRAGFYQKGKIIMLIILVVVLLPPAQPFVALQAQNTQNKDFHEGFHTAQIRCDGSLEGAAVYCIFVLLN